MKILRILTILLITHSLVHAQAVTPTASNTFVNALEQSKMVFRMPPGAVEIPRIKNKQMHYEFAIKFPGKPLEIRYSIMPLDKRMESFIQAQKDNDPAIKNPNDLSKPIAFVVANNVAGGGIDTTLKYMPFPAQAVQQDFNADWGGTSFFALKNASFGTDYKYCLMVIIHREDVADAYIFYLSDTKENLKGMYNDILSKPQVLYALKFQR